jgi:hypothetical protein
MKSSSEAEGPVAQPRKATGLRTRKAHGQAGCTEAHYSLGLFRYDKQFDNPPLKDKPAENQNRVPNLKMANPFINPPWLEYIRFTPEFKQLAYLKSDQVTPN